MRTVVWTSLIVCLLAVAPVWAQDPPPAELAGAAAENEELSRERDRLAQRAADVAERLKAAETALKTAQETLQNLKSAYAGGEGAPEAPAREEVHRLLRSLEERAPREALAAILEPLAAEESTLKQTQAQAADRLATLEEDFARMRDAAQEEEWRRLERERGELLRDVRGKARTVGTDLARLQQLLRNTHRAQREALFLLRRENLLLRGKSHLTWESLAQGVEEARRLPEWLAAAGKDLGAYLTQPAHRGALLGLLGAAVVVGLFFFRLGRSLRRRAERLAAATVPENGKRVGLIIARLIRACAIALVLFLLPFIASVLLPDLGEGVGTLLRALALVLGLAWLVHSFHRELLRPDVVQVEAWAARRISLGVRLLLWLSLVFLPVLLALGNLGYRNQGVLELLWIAYKVLMALVVLFFLMQRRLVESLLPSAERRAGRFLRFLVTYLRPLAVLLVPALLVLDALRFDILATLITRFALATLAVAVLGATLYRVVRFVLDHLLRAAFDPDSGGAPARKHAAARDGSLFFFRVVLFFIAVWAILELSGSGTDELRGFFDAPLPLQDPAGAHPATWWNLIVGAVLFFLVIVAAKHVKRVLRELVLGRTKLDEGVQYTITTLSGYVFLTLGLYVALREVFDLSNLGYVLAALSVGIGFGLQEIVSNFISGLILLFERPLKVGDMVQVGGADGVVKHISIRATTVQTRDNVYLLVPNRSFITEMVTNYAYRDPKIRVRVPLGVSYASDTAQVREVLLQIATNHTAVLRTPAPDVWFTGFGDSSIDFELLVWIADPPQHNQVRSELYFAAFDAFRENGIEIPFPQRDLHVRSAIPLPIAAGGGDSTEA